MTSGHVSWPPESPVWSFDYWVSEPPDSEGLVIFKARFRDRLVFHKASLPLIRVWYNGGLGHGPYKDPLSSDNLVSFRVYEGPIGSFRFLVVNCYHKIGHYRLTNRWIFRDDGVVLPQLYSAGLQHPEGHQHHVYWRFDFDLDGGPANDLAFWRHNIWLQDWGWGPGWWPITHEQRMVKEPHARLWAVMDVQTGRGYFIAPGPFDGEADWFSRGDVWVVRYHGHEDLRGRLGSASNDGLNAHHGGESTHATDIVIWYCAHLAHLANDNGDEWQVCGPILTPFRY